MFERFLIIGSAGMEEMPAFPHLESGNCQKGVSYGIFIYEKNQSGVCD